MKRILTALQPSGLLHIGNYFGAIEPMAASQDEGENLLFIVDYHAITVPQDPEALRRNILFAAATYLAAGIDPKKTMLFQQSRVCEHAELAWILNCVARMGELERMTQFKDKAKGKGESVTVGLFGYPVLMAADILLYDTSEVPVGADQKQHVELARDLAERFNRDFGETFVVPEPRIRASGARIMALDDPMKKMSKSAQSEKSYVSLMDGDDAVIAKIKAAVTDSQEGISYDPAERPGLANLLTIFGLVTGQNPADVANEYQGKGFGELKADLGEALVVWLKPLRAAIEAHLKDEEELKRVLDLGASEAQAIASKKMEEVRERIGVKL